MESLMRVRNLFCGPKGHHSDECPEKDEFLTELHH